MPFCNNTIFNRLHGFQYHKHTSYSLRLMYELEGFYSDLLQKFSYSQDAQFSWEESTMRFTGAAIQEHSPRLQQSNTQASDHVHIWLHLKTDHLPPFKAAVLYSLYPAAEVFSKSLGISYSF